MAQRVCEVKVKLASIISALQTQLQDDATLADYVKQFFLGVRENVADFPCIIIEPISMTEGGEVYPLQEMNAKVSVIGYVKIEDADEQLIGGDDTVGVLNLENDIKKAISSDITLGGECYHVTIEDSNYDYTLWPIRSVRLTLNVFFRQLSTTRV